MPSVRGPRRDASRPADAATDGEPAPPAKEQGTLGKIISLLGSLELALILLGGTSLLLISGTFLESWYGAAIAAQLIYQSWWFGYLLALLAVNIACAALKKWPWKKHQTGFLITHIGLLTLLAGGAISTAFGTSGMMLLVDSPQLANASFGVPVDDHLYDRRRDTLRIRRPERSQDDILEADFAPGWIPWNESGLDSTSLNPFARVLAWISQPTAPLRRWSMDEIDIELMAYAPQADWDPVRPAATSAASRTKFPAIRFRIESPMAGKLPSQWIGDDDPIRAAHIGPGFALWQASRCTAAHIKEFAREPDVADRKEKGELVIGWSDHQWRIPVSSLGEESRELVDGWKLGRVKYQADALHIENPAPTDPALSFELTSPNNTTYGLVTRARRGGSLFPMPGYPPPNRLPSDFWVWYHPPDATFANPALRGMMRVAIDDTNRAWLKTLHRGPAPQDPWIAEPIVEIKEGAQPLSIWPAMQGQLFIERFLREAEGLPDCRPRTRVGESEDSATPPAILCRLSRGSIRQEVWLPRRTNVEVAVPLGSETIELTYSMRREPLGFAVALERAALQREAASGMPEFQSSTLRIQDSDGNVLTGKTTLNEPFEHRGYKLYQGAILNVDGDLPESRHRSILLVGYDPGVWLKYAGSLLVCLGIACMFWMKAYFFGSWWDDAATETIRNDESPLAENN